MLLIVHARRSPCVPRTVRFLAVHEHAGAAASALDDSVLEVGNPFVHRREPGKRGLALDPGAHGGRPA